MNGLYKSARMFSAPEVPATAPTYPACFAGLDLDRVNWQLANGYASKADAAALVKWWNESGKRLTVARLCECAVVIAGREFVAPVIRIS